MYYCITFSSSASIKPLQSESYWYHSFELNEWLIIQLRFNSLFKHRYLSDAKLPSWTQHLTPGDYQIWTEEENSPPWEATVQAGNQLIMVIDNGSDVILYTSLMSIFPSLLSS